MTNSRRYQADIQQDRFGLKVAARLSALEAQPPHDISERLRVARMQAVARRKVERPASAAFVLGAGGSAVLGGGDEGLTWWNRIASAVPLLVLAIGLVAINTIQNENVANELAAVDAALLVDDLPPEAYADPGFAQFINLSRKDGL